MHDAQAVHPPADANEPPDIVCLGDSFTHGSEVTFEDTWPAQLAAATGRRVSNLGVDAYGVDQAALRYGYSGLSARIVLLGMIPGDFDRALRTVLYRRTTASKPIFKFEAEGPRVLNQPAAAGEELRREMELREHSPLLSMSLDFEPLLFRRDIMDFLFLYRAAKSAFVWQRLNSLPPYRSGDLRFEHGVNVLLYLRKSVEQRGGRLVVVFLDDEFALMDRGRVAFPWKPLQDRLAREGIATIDASEPIYRLYREDRDLAFNRGARHYTPRANAKIASIVAESLLSDQPSQGPRPSPVAITP